LRSASAPSLANLERETSLELATSTLARPIPHYATTSDTELYTGVYSVLLRSARQSVPVMREEKKEKRRNDRCSITRHERAERAHSAGC
jgi:hypothetical protein